MSLPLTPTDEPHQMSEFGYSSSAVDEEDQRVAEGDRVTLIHCGSTVSGGGGVVSPSVAM